MSIVSAPEEVINQNELEALPVSRSEVEYRVSIPRRRKEFTEKGKAFLKSTRDKSRQKAFRNLMREANALKSKCNEQEIELEELEAGRDLIDSLKEKFNEAHHAYESTLEASPEKEESYRWFDVRDREFTECRMRICETMQSLERSSVASSKSRSVRSSCASKRSSHSSRKSSICNVRGFFNMDKWKGICEARPEGLAPKETQQLIVTSSIHSIDELFRLYYTASFVLRYDANTAGLATNT